MSTTSATGLQNELDHITFTNSILSYDSSATLTHVELQSHDLSLACTH